MPTNTQIKMGLLIGLAAFVEVSLAAPQLVVTCFDICHTVCRSFGSWVPNGNCTGGSFGNYNYDLSVNTGRATDVKVTKDSVSPVSVFSVKYNGGVMCECMPANGQEFATLNIPSNK
jgi:hypothetical protein